MYAVNNVNQNIVCMFYNFTNVVLKNLKREYINFIKQFNNSNTDKHTKMIKMLSYIGWLNVVQCLTTVIILLVPIQLKQ